MMIFSAWKCSNHCITINAPTLFGSSRHFGFLFGRLRPAFRWAAFSARLRSGFNRGVDLCFGFSGVLLAPKTVICTTAVFCFALGLTAGHAAPARYIGCSPIPFGAANDTRDKATGLYIGHGFQVLNWVNSWNNTVLLVERNGVNHEPSRACNNLRIARGAEGATTRGCGNNNPPTSAQPERDDIVWTAWRHAEVGHKQAGDNKIDDVLNITPSDVFTAAQYPIAQAAVAVSISGLEMLQNSGKEKMIDLLESRISNAERTFQNNLSNDAYSNGTADGGKQIGGLQLLIAAINNSGIIGGIDSSVWGFWQNSVLSFAAQGLSAGASTMQTMMNRLWLSIARQSDRPDLFIADNTYFRYYWESLQAIQRITDERNGMAGFMALKFMDADVVYDGGFQGNTQGNVNVLGGGGSWLSGSGAPTSTMYGLNTDYIFLRPHKDRDMVPLDPDRFSVNQDAMVKLIAWAGNLTMSNRFLQGIVTS